MRILVLSDTHVSSDDKPLPCELKNVAKASNCIIHAGDIISLGTVKQLSSWSTLHAVYGNMDNQDIKKLLPRKLIITCQDLTIGIIHGSGSPSGIIHYIQREFEPDMKKLDVIIFGHSHLPCDKEIDGIIYFNPGSPTDRVFAPYLSYGILEIDGKQLKRRIIKIG